MLKTVLMLGLFLGLNAQAFEGRYEGSGHYGDVVVTERGPEGYLIETCAYYGPHCMEIVAIAQEMTEGRYSTITGTIEAHYGNLQCEYPIRLSFSEHQGRLYISEYGPGYFPSRSRGCPVARELGYRPYIERTVYERVGDLPEPPLPPVPAPPEDEEPVDPPAPPEAPEELR